MPPPGKPPAATMPPPQQSPPKRMTRARAKAVEDKKVAVKTITVATPSTKLTVTRNAKRKVRDDEEEENTQPKPVEQLDSLESMSEPSNSQNTKSHPKCATSSGASSTTSRPVVDVKGDEEKASAVKRPRGRPRKLQNLEVTKPDAITETILTNSRVRAQRVGNTVGKVGISAPPLRKRVTFEVEDSEKENSTRHPATPAKSTKKEDKTESVLRPTGVNARPIRRAAPVGRRGKKAAEKDESAKESESVTLEKESQLDNGNAVNNHDNDSDDLGDGRSPAKPDSNHIEDKTKAPDARSPAKLAGQIAAGIPITPARVIEEGTVVDELQDPQTVILATLESPSQIKVKTPGQLAALSAAKLTSTANPANDLRSEKATKGNPAKTASSIATALTQLPKKIQPEMPPSVPIFKTPALPSRITGTPMRRPVVTGSSVTSYPGTTVKPTSSVGTKSSIYGTPARKPTSPRRIFAPALGTDFPQFNGKTSLIQSSPRRPPSPQRTMDLSPTVAHAEGKGKFKSSLYGTPARRPASPTKAFTPASTFKLAPSEARPGPLASPPRKPISPQREFTASSAVKPVLASSISKSANFDSPKRHVHASSNGSPVSTRYKQPSAASVMGAMAQTAWSRTPNRESMNSEVMVTSSLKPNRSPEAMYRVHKMTSEEQVKVLQNELVNAPSPFTPAVKSAKKGIKNEVRNTPNRRTLALKVSLETDQSSFQKHDEMPIETFGKETEQSIKATALDEENNNSMTPPGVPSSPVRIIDMQLRTQEMSLDDDDSEDELQVDRSFCMPTPTTWAGPTQLGAGVPFTPTPRSHTKGQTSSVGKGPMTALADRFSEWKGLGPEKETATSNQAERLILSPSKTTLPEINTPAKDPSLSPIKFHLPSFENGEMTTGFMFSPEKASQFEEAMAIREDPDDASFEAVGNSVEDDLFRQSQMSEASQEYGDENATPVLPTFIPSSVAKNIPTCTPARVFAKQPITIHTVSKVPLKPSADYDESPLARPRRSHSLSGPLSKQSELELQALRQVHPLPSASRVPLAERTAPFDPPLSLAIQELPSTPTPNPLSVSVLGTPARTPRPDVNSNLLNGCVVFVDVHTTEGADASGIFIELLTQMGARCVKQWTWNPSGSPAAESDEIKVGITHVVFKDGGRRTMEKVRETKGLVVCVGVAWVLDCERENKWLDESDYTIDISTIPRGGHRRRKSMEPKALSSNLQHTTPLLSPTKEFLNLDSPAPSTEQKEQQQIYTPPHANISDRDPDCTSTLSPTTPYFLRPQNLVQQTCPPKQTQESLFSVVAGTSSREMEGNVRRKLELVRRKSLQWAPRVGSPLRGGL